MLRITRWTLLVLIGSTAVCSAATSPVGRPLKFYEASQTSFFRIVGPAETCSTLPLQAGCVQADSLGNATFNNVEIGLVTASASFGRSTLCANANTQVSYAFRGRSGGVADLASFVVQTRYEIRSAVLDDASLINSLTGAPFNGRIVFNLQSQFADQDYLAPLQRLARNQKIGSMDCGSPLLSYQMLTTRYGLSSTLAQRLLGGAITVRHFISGSVMMFDGGTYSVQLRMIGD